VTDLDNVQTFRDAKGGCLISDRGPLSANPRVGFRAPPYRISKFFAGKVCNDKELR
jgi:hypothetical protein